MAKKTPARKSPANYQETLEGFKVGDVVRFNEKGHQIAFNAHNFTGVITRIATRTIVEVQWKKKTKVMRFEWSKGLRKATIARRSKI